MWRQKKLETLRCSWFTLWHSASKIKFLQRKLKQTAPDCGPSSSQFGASDACLAIAGYRNANDWVFHRQNRFQYSANRKKKQQHLAWEAGVETVCLRLKLAIPLVRICCWRYTVGKLVFLFLHCEPDAAWVHLLALWNVCQVLLFIFLNSPPNKLDFSAKRIQFSFSPARSYLTISCWAFSAADLALSIVSTSVRVKLNWSTLSFFMSLCAWLNLRFWSPSSAALAAKSLLDR